MNIRNVLRTYSLLRQLSDDETALLNTLRSMNDAERESLVIALSPEKPATKRGAKKGSSKSVSASKSSRASGMAAAINRSLDSSRKASQATLDAANDPRTIADRCGICGNDADYQDHFKPSPHYHEFDAGKSFAPPAGERSSTNGGGTNSTANSAVEPENV